MTLASSRDYYEVLQVSHGAQPLIINKAFRLLAAMYHPDNGRSADPDAFHEVVEAYRTLSDPVRRAAYDREHRGAIAEPRPYAGAAVTDREAPEPRIHDEREIRHLILQALYHTRRSTPARPSVPLMAIPELFGCSIDDAQFTLWDLRGKKLIEMMEDGLAITIAGVDAIEAAGSSEPIALPPGPPMIEASASAREMPAEGTATV